jgi:hypothetical protein
MLFVDQLSLMSHFDFSVSLCLRIHAKQFGRPSTFCEVDCAAAQ